jgi:ankyrin repeat protein
MVRSFPQVCGYIDEPRGWTPLFYASQTGNIELTTAVIDSESTSINQYDNEKYTALSALSTVERVPNIESIISLLLSRGALILDALFIAVHDNKNVEMVKILVNLGVDVNSSLGDHFTTKDSSTPLSYAIRDAVHWRIHSDETSIRNSVAIVGILLDDGADPMAGEGKIDCCQLAKAAERPDLAKMIQRRIDDATGKLPKSLSYIEEESVLEIIRRHSAVFRKYELTSPDHRCTGDLDCIKTLNETLYDTILELVGRLSAVQTKGVVKLS